MRRLVRFGTAAALLIIAAPAGAQHTIDFSAYSSPTTTEYAAAIGAPLNAGGLSFYNSSGLRAQARNVLGTWGTDESDEGSMNIPANIEGSTALFGTSFGAPGGVDIFAEGYDLVTGAGYRTFGLLSIDVAHLYSAEYLGSTLSPFSLQFGGRLGTTTFFQTFLIGAPADGIPMLQTLTFDSRFGTVDRVFWNQGATEATLHQFTNVVATPEPGSMLLLGTGLAAIALTLRRRRKQQVGLAA